MDDLKKSVMDIWNKSTTASGSSGKFKGQGHRLGGGEGSSAPPAGSGRGASGHGAGRGANPPSSGGRPGGGSSGTGKAGPSTAGAARPVAVGRSGAAAERMLHDRHVTQQQQQEKQMEERRRALKDQQQAGTAPVRPADGSFDPFSPHFTSGAAASSYASVKRQEGQDQQRQRQQQEPPPLPVAQCPVCMRFSGTEQEVAAHVDVCLSLGMDTGGPLTLSNDDGPSSRSTPPAPSSATPAVAPSPAGTAQAPAREMAFKDTLVSEHPADVDRTMAPPEASTRHWAGSSAADEIHNAAGLLLSVDTPPATLDILRKLLSNVLADPGNEKFRRVRMSNPKIAQSIGAATGGVEMLLAVGFAMKEDGGDTWALLEGAASDQTQAALQEALSLLPPPLPPPSLAQPAPAQSSAPAAQSGAAAAPAPAVKAPAKFDRQVRVFLSASENSASRIEVPDSFYDRSGEDVRQEAMARRKALESSQVMMTRASREKQKEALKRKYKLCVLRVLLPDGLVLQGLFRPWELTSSIYEFVAGALRDPTQEFQLMHSVPMAGRSNLIPSVAAPSAPIPSLEKEQLVPASLIKFKPFCLGPPGYTGLARDLLDRVEQLTAVPLPTAER